VKFLKKIYRLIVGYERDYLLKAMPKNSIAAEIGVYKGEFSVRILKIVKPQKLYLIDPWKYEVDEIYQKSLYGGESGKSQENMDKIYETVLQHFIGKSKKSR
jgi:hypothetical protein